ncbi:hypothetical protein LZ31DRAFT_330789 [Colletotrichum somersetense]|nr:hypothetical protein LZ31DRAFT_330789 [Colletotrichum somersetense]
MCMPEAKNMSEDRLGEIERNAERERERERRRRVLRVKTREGGESPAACSRSLVCPTLLTTLLHFRSLVLFFLFDFCFSWIRRSFRPLFYYVFSTQFIGLQTHLPTLTENGFSSHRPRVIPGSRAAMLSPPPHIRVRSAARQRTTFHPSPPPPFDVDAS